MVYLTCNKLTSQDKKKRKRPGRGKEITMKTLTKEALNALTVKELIAMLETLAGQPMPSKVKKASRKPDLVNAILELQATANDDNTTKEEPTMKTEENKKDVTPVTEPAPEKKAVKRTKKSAPETLLDKLAEISGTKKVDRKKAVFMMNTKGTRRVWEVYYFKGAYDVYLHDDVALEYMLDLAEFESKRVFHEKYNMKNVWTGCTHSEVLAILASIA